ncbi:MAG: PAS domain S-box protein [Desulfobacterales bacterium]|nr:PAS domain S-box protein [Desulfobacterales bacterium]
MRTYIKAKITGIDEESAADVPASPRILVTDDDDLVLRSLKDILNETYKTAVTESPKEALEMLRQTPYEILLADLMMNEMNGMDLIRAALSIRPGIIPIVITGYASKEDAVAAFKEGVYDFLEKPFTPGIVLQSIARAWKSLQADLENYKLLRSVQESEKRYRLLTENVADGVSIIQDRKFVFVNPALTSILGYTGDRLIGQEPFVFYHDDYKAYLKKTLEKLENNIPVKYFLSLCVRGDGREIWTEERYSFIEWEGRPAILVTVRDITETKLREIAIQKEAEHIRGENINLRTTLKKGYRFGSIIGKSPAMQKIYDLILEAASTRANVIIYGESGTGKELVAKAIHDMSDSCGKAFVPVNCGAIPENLLESEFFGYKRGAFTGAVSDKCGFLDIADKGTLFLDEIGELSLSMQVKLLRAIEGRGYTPVGGNEVKTPNVRIIGATHRNLDDHINNGLMRLDFFYRIHIIPVRLPPLRERKEDLPMLIYHFLQKHSNSEKTASIPDAVMKTLHSYDWPGNIRELQNVIQRYITLKKLELKGFRPFNNSRQGDLTDETAVQEFHTQDLHSAVEKFEKTYIARILELNKGNRSRTAKVLEIERRTLQRKIKNYGLT